MFSQWLASVNISLPICRTSQVVYSCNIDFVGRCLSSWVWCHVSWHLYTNLHVAILQVMRRLLACLWKPQIVHMLYVFICRETWIISWRKRTILCLFPLFMEARCWCFLWCMLTLFYPEDGGSTFFEIPGKFCKTIQSHPNPRRLCSWSIFFIWCRTHLLKVLEKSDIGEFGECQALTMT